MGKHWPPRGPDDLDEERRARMRRDILSHLRPRAPTFSDHAYAVLSLLAAPAPYIVRAGLSLVVVAALVASATVASADSLPDEPLYGVKVASEQLRLALAQTPEDRAAVWLSMAEHRLTEAERLALAGREPEALVAASAYGTQLAEAAAELAAIERLEAKGPSVVARLKERLASQQARATDIAERLRTGAANARSAPAFDTVASAPPADPSGTLSELIAEHAAAVTDQVAAVAEQRAADEAVPVPPTAAAPAPAVAPRATAPQRATQPQRQQTPARQAQTQESAPPQGIGSVTAPEATVTPAAPTSTASTATDERAAETKKPGIGQELSEIQRRFKDALEQIREKQKEAREAVKKAQERGKKTPDPARSRSVDRDADGEDAD